ncbi:MAG: protein translocase subunit SecF [Bacillota bacterium]|jgi:preprotein translocase subunit SecF
MIRPRAINFMGHSRLWLTLSLVLILVGLAFIALPGYGMRLGIDFTGGSLLDLKFQEPTSTMAIREVMAKHGLGNSVIQRASADGREIIIRTRPLEEELRREVTQDLKSEVSEFEVVRIEEVKGVISRELTQKAFLALAIAVAGMLVYITLRFEFKFAVAAIVALAHDVLIVVGVFSILGMEVNSSFVAAVLAIIGYSINDTIVIFDRIRENLKSRKKESLEEVVNNSLNQTLGRSINTSLTTLLAVGAVFVFGGKTTQDFALALIVGIVSGTYSSLLVASPIWVWWKNREALAKSAKA